MLFDDLYESDYFQLMMNQNLPRKIQLSVYFSNQVNKMSMWKNDMQDRYWLIQEDYQLLKKKRKAKYIKFNQDLCFNKAESQWTS